MDRPALNREDEVRRSPVHFPENRKPAPAWASLRIQHGNITGPVTDEGEAGRPHMRDDHLARQAWLLADPRSIDDFDDNVLGAQVQSSLRTLMGDEAEVSPTVAVGNATPEGRLDRCTLVGKELLRSNESHLHPETPQRPATQAGMLGDPGEC